MIRQLSQATLTLAGTRREPLPDFASLVREHQAMVYSIAKSYLQDPGAAEEIAQDVFLELHRALPTLETPSHVTNWLRRVAAHRSIDAIRRHRATLPLMDVREPAVEAETGDVLLHDKLRKLVATLPETARMMVILRYQEGLALEEISELLNVSVRSVKGRLHRTIALMREKLERQVIPRNPTGLGNRASPHFSTGRGQAMARGASGMFEAEKLSGVGNDVESEDDA